MVEYSANPGPKAIRQRLNYVWEKVAEASGLPMEIIEEDFARRKNYVIKEIKKFPNEYWLRAQTRARVPQQSWDILRNYGVMADGAICGDTLRATRVKNRYLKKTLYVLYDFGL